MPRQLLHALATAALVAVAAFSGPSPAGAEGPAKPEIMGRGTAFAPKDLEVNKGTEVTWRIADGETQAHNVILDDPKADCSGDSDCEKKNNSDDVLGAGTTFVRKFEKPGEYRYHCAYHGGTGGQGMSGIVRVIDPSAPPPTEASSTTTTATTATTAPPPVVTTATTAPPPPPAPKPPAPKVEPTTTTKPTQASAAGKAKQPKPPKPATTTGPSTTTTKAPETTTTVAAAPLPALGELPPLVQAPSETTSTTRPGSGEGFEAINGRSPRGGAKKLTMAAVGTLGVSLMAGGLVWWRRRPSRYWSA